MDLIDNLLACGLFVIGIYQLVIVFSIPTRRESIRKIHRKGKQTRKAVDKASKRHLKNVSRLYDDLKK